MRAILLLLLLWFTSTDASLFSSSNPTITSSFVTLFTNTTSIDNLPSAGSQTQRYDHNILPSNSTQPDASGVSGILYDRQQSCQQNVTGISPELLTNQPKIALVRQGGCSVTDKALYAQRDNAVAVIVYATVPFDTTQGVNNPMVADTIKIPVFYTDLELGQTLYRLLQQPDPISQAPNNVSYQTAVKVILYPFIGGFPTAWEFILIIVVALLALSFLISMGMHWHLWRIRRGQRVVYETGLSMSTLPAANDKVIDPVSLSIFPTRIIGDQQVIQRRASAVSIRKGRALENAEALAATIVHPRQPASTTPLPSCSSSSSCSPSTATTTSPSSPRRISEQDILPTITTPPSRQEEPSIKESEVEDDTQTACVICLDEFAIGESVRKLPCGHEYHCECIDPWLTIKSASCPLCKYDCSLNAPKNTTERGVNDEERHPFNGTSSRNSSIFSLAFLRQRMDDDAEQSQRQQQRQQQQQQQQRIRNASNTTTSGTPPSTISSFGPTIPADQAEAFSRTWMARSLPRNMRRQINLAAQQAAENQRQEQVTVTLPTRMLASPEPAALATSHHRHQQQQQQQQQQQSRPPSTSSR